MPVRRGFPGGKAAPGRVTIALGGLEHLACRSFFHFLRCAGLSIVVDDEHFIDEPGFPEPVDHLGADRLDRVDHRRQAPRCEGAGDDAPLPGVAGVKVRIGTEPISAVVPAGGRWVPVESLTPGTVFQLDGNGQPLTLAHITPDGDVVVDGGEVLPGVKGDTKILPWRRHSAGVDAPDGSRGSRDGQDAPQGGRRGGSGARPGDGPAPDSGRGGPGAAGAPGGEARPDTGAGKPAGASPLPIALETTGGRMPDWVTVDSLQMGDYVRVEGITPDGRPITGVGYVMESPQLGTFHTKTRKFEVVGFVLSDDINGNSPKRTVWVPSDRLAAMAPRPEDYADLVLDGEQPALNKRMVAKGEMPDAIPLDADRRLPLFPRSMVQDVDGQRSGVVLASRGKDVTVRWDNDDVEDVAAPNLRVTDGGIAGPAGWGRDGKRRAYRRIGAPKSAKARRDAAINREIEDSIRDLIDLGLVEFKSAADLDEFVARMVKLSQKRRVAAARKIARRRKSKPGHLAKLIAALTQLAVEVAKALWNLLRRLFSADNRTKAKEAASAVLSEKNRRLAKEKSAAVARAIRSKVAWFPAAAGLEELAGVEAADWFFDELEGS